MCFPTRYCAQEWGLVLAFSSLPGLICGAGLAPLMPITDVLQSDPIVAEIHNSLGLVYKVIKSAKQFTLFDQALILIKFSYKFTSTSFFG